MHALVPAAVYPSASAKLHDAAFPQASPKAAAEVEKGALVFPTSPLSTLPRGLELNQGCPVPERGGH